MKCFVLQCKNSTDLSGNALSYHMFPKDEQIRREWLIAIGRIGSNVSYHRVCSDHFGKNDFVFKKQKRRLKTGTIPSKNLPNTKPEDVFSDCLEEFEEEFNRNFEEIPINLPENLPCPDTINTNALGRKSLALQEKELNVPSTSGLQSNRLKRPYKQILEKSLCESSTSDSPSTSSATSSAKRRLVNTFHSYSLSPEHYKKQVIHLKKRIGTLKVKYENIKRTSKRRKQVIKSLKDIVLNLKRKHALSSNAVEVLESTFSGVPLDLMKRMIMNNSSKNKGKKVTRSAYPEVLKSFAMTLQFYSAKAYNYVRKTFDLVLPAPSTIRSWLAKVDCSPGFTQPALVTLKNKASSFKVKNGFALLGCLIMDEMSLRKEISLERHTQNVWGYVDVGAHTSDDQEEATEALVLMVVGVNDNFKVPIGYFFINKMTGFEKANLVKEALYQIAKTEVKILAITCDGPQVHFKMMSDLGCSIRNPNNLKTSFLNPVDSSPVHVIFDVCHMLKLVRNNWARNEIWIDQDGNKLKWEYITKLHDLQDEKGLYLGNKLRKKHIDWEKAAMKVQLAAQTLSSSVTDALEFLCKDLELEEFKEVMPTVNFIRKINNLFDFLNSRNPFGKGMNAPMKVGNKNYWRVKVEDILFYLKELKTINKIHVYRTRSRVPILGLIVSTTSLINIFDLECKSKQSLKYVLTYKFSQDHLELFFNGVIDQEMAPTITPVV